MMKNSLNLIAVILLFVVLGCTCPGIGSFVNKKQVTPAPSNSPKPANSSDSPGTESPPAKSSPVSGLSIEKYNKLKIGMPKSEADKILGSAGTEISTSSGGGVTFSVFKYSGENYAAIILSFKDDKIMSRSQVGLK